MIILSAALALPVAAQQPQIPNGGFEDGWGDCTPWTSKGNTKTQGTTPGSWIISQVVGINGLGATTVGKDTIGYESEKAVAIYNSANSLMSSQIVPGYVTLGTTWSTSVMGKQNDGGTFGGIKFSGRPVKITFKYKFEKESENDQPANAIAYLWKGTYTQAGVPGNIEAFGTPKAVDMVNRDRNILGMETVKGGEITSKGELIAKGTTVITETTSDWTMGEIVFEYLSDATPEMLNIIFAANDYFNSEGIAKGNMLIVDNVEAVYPEPQLEKEDVYKGTVDIKMMGSPVGTPAANVHIKYYNDGTCDFELPDFKLGGEDSESLGSIKVPNVTIDKSNTDKFSYQGSVKNLSLGGGVIIADVDNLTGTTDNNGNADFDILVSWDNEGTKIPITVTFSGKLDNTTGIDDIEAVDADAPVEYYNLQGVRVADPTPGLYIRRQGNNVSKVIIR